MPQNLKGLSFWMDLFMLKPMTLKWKRLLIIETPFLFSVCCFLITGCLPGSVKPRRIPEPNGKIAITFVYQGKARTVCVCGDFNQWSPRKDCMKREGKTWKLRILLAPGRYRYLFLIDGRRWITDPKAYLNEDDGYGRKNSVLIVE